MRLLALLLATGLFAGALLADDKKPIDEEAILGTWQAVKYDDGTVENPREKAQIQTRMTFAEGGKLVMVRGTNEFKGSYVIDPAAMPKALDQTGERGTTLAAYSLDGDTLTLALTTNGRKERPDALKADGKGIAVMTLKRVKVEKSKDADALVGKWRVVKYDDGTAENPREKQWLGDTMAFADGGKLVVDRGGRSSEAKFELNPTAKPPTLDMIAEDGTAPAAYKIDGDTLTLAVLSGDRRTRPDALKADGKGIAVMTLKRVKAEKKEDKKDK